MNDHGRSRSNGREHCEAKHGRATGNVSRLTTKTNGDGRSWERWGPREQRRRGVERGRERREEDGRRTGDKARGDSLGDISATGWFVAMGRKTVPKHWRQKRGSQDGEVGEETGKEHGKTVGKSKVNVT